MFSKRYFAPLECKRRPHHPRPQALFPTPPRKEPGDEDASTRARFHRDRFYLLVRFVNVDIMKEYITCPFVSWIQS